MKPSLVIMAAGMASRYGGDLKQLDPVGVSGETIMEYSVYDAAKAGFGEVVFVIRKSFEKQFCDKIIKKLKKYVKTDYVFQELDMLPEGFICPAGRQKPWGATQAVLAASDKINMPFGVINADDYYGQEAFQLMYKFLSDRDGISNSFAMVGYELQNTLSDHGTVSRGICRTTSNGYLMEVNEQHKIERFNKDILSYNGEGKAVSVDGSSLVSMNFWGFTPTVFNLINKHFSQFLSESGHELKSEYPLPTVVDHIMKAGEATVKVLPCNQSWFGVTYKEDKSAVIDSIKELAIKGLYPEALWE